MQFNSFPKFQSLNLKNSVELIKKIKDIKVSGEYLLSFDVCSLFQSTPKETLLKILEN